MTFQIAYWVLMLVWVAVEATSKPLDLKSHKGNLILFVLLVLLGWKVLGPPLHQ